MNIRNVYTADSGWAFNDVKYRVRYHGWLVALRGKLSDVARGGMISFCLRKGPLSYRSVCHGDWNQDRIFLLFYKRITPVYIVEEELISLEYSKFVERIVNEVPHLRRGKFSKLSLMKRSAHLQYPQIDLEISLLVDHLFLQWFYRWWCLRSEDKRFSWDIRATVFLTVSMFNLHSV